MKAQANTAILDLFSEENLAAVAAQSTRQMTVVPTFDDERVVSIFAYAEPMKGINDYPETYESLRIPFKSKKDKQKEIEELLADAA